MDQPLVAADVLRRMVQERLQMHLRGELPLPEFRGYLTAMFHAGAISSEELHQILAAKGDDFKLTPPESN